MNNYIVFRTIGMFLIPVMFLFGWYVLFHGKVSPGGGFQGGAICSTAIILHTTIFGIESTRKVIPTAVLRVIACMGAFIYGVVGLICIFKGGQFLDYAVLFNSDAHLGEFVGVMAIEFGIQITVFAVLTLLFINLANYVNSQAK